MRRRGRDRAVVVVTAWLVVVAVGVGSYVARAVPVVVGARWLRAPRVVEAIEHAGTAALAALIAIGLRHGATTPADALTVGLAAAVAVVVAVRGAPMHTVLLVGAIAYAAAAGGMWLVS
jgi:branched-subunit amino acid transport protein